MTANNESKESQVQGRGLTQRTIPVWKKGLRTLKNCARTGGVPTDLLIQHLSEKSRKGYCLNVLYLLGSLHTNRVSEKSRKGYCLNVLYLLGSLHTNRGVSYCSH